MTWGSALCSTALIYVIANIRGGGELRRGLARAGMLTKKQNVFDDFAACAKWLIDHATRIERASPSKAAATAGLLRAPHSLSIPKCSRHVATRRDLRYVACELSPNGAFNVPSSGHREEADQFKALYATLRITTYRRTQYPAVLFLDRCHDPRVEPANSRKMTGSPASQRNQQPVYLRTTDSAGHGIGAASANASRRPADVYAFLCATLKSIAARPAARRHCVLRGNSNCARENGAQMVEREKVAYPIKIRSRAYSLGQLCRKGRILLFSGGVVTDSL